MTCGHMFLVKYPDHNVMSSISNIPQILGTQQWEVSPSAVLGKCCHGDVYPWPSAAAVAWTWTVHAIPPAPPTSGLLYTCLHTGIAHWLCTWASSTRTVSKVQDKIVTSIASQNMESFFDYIDYSSSSHISAYPVTCCTRRMHCKNEWNPLRKPMVTMVCKSLK